MGLNNFTTSTGVAEFTDVEADSLGLPSGYTITEDAGDLVITDTDGTIVLRRIDNGSWSFEGNTVEAGQVGTSSSPVDVEADSINANQLGTSTNPVSVEADSINTSQSITENGQDVISSPDDDYEIQKDGTDGTGIINFKTV